MINLNVLKNLSKEYEKYNNLLEKYKKQKLDFEIKYERELEKLNEAKKKIEDPVEREEFIQKNMILNEYDHYIWQIMLKEKMIRRLLYGINQNEYDDEKIYINGIPYILLKHLKDDSYDIVNLKEQEIINLDTLSDVEKEFLIKLLKYQEVLIGWANIEDLPLLMNIIENANFDEKVGSLRMHYKCAMSKMEYQKAKMFDKRDLKTTFINPITNEREEAEYELPFIYDSRLIERMWYHLDELENVLSTDDYWIEYYKYLMLFDNNIESIYNEAPDDHKKYVIDAYYKYSVGEKNEYLDKYIKFRTASPLINTEVLKRKYAKIK